AVFPRLLVQAREALELHDRARRPERVPAAGVAPALELEVDGRRVVHRRRHLPGYEAQPDQLVQAELIRVQVLLDGLGAATRVGGADRLVSLLRPALLAARPETRTARCGEAFTEVLRDEGARHRGSLGRDARRVRAHVRDEPRRTFRTEVDPLVELLGDAHRLL